MLKLTEYLRLSGRNLFADRSAAVGLFQYHGAAGLVISVPQIAETIDANYPQLANCLDSAPDDLEPDLQCGTILSIVTAALCNLLDDVSGPIEAVRDEVTGGVFFGATCHDDRVAPRLKLAFDIVADILIAISENRQVSAGIQDQIEALERYIEVQSFGINALIVLRSARKRGIPWFRVRFGQDMSIAQLGWGCNARRFNVTRGPATAYLACRLSHDKHATARALARIGLPVPVQQIVETADDACRAAEQIGYPVVVKPLDSSGGRGVAVDIRDEESVRQSYSDARRYSRRILVETALQGDDYRLLVINGRFMAAARRDRARIIGDGKSTVKSLLAEFNRDPRRKSNRLAMMHQVPFSGDVERTLLKQRLTIDDVPEKGRTVFIRSPSSVHAGGSAYDISESVHPDNRDVAVRASLAVGLDIAGIDLLTPDITRSWREVGGGICEVNDLPGLDVHEIAESETERDYGGMVLDAIFQPGDDGRIPVVIVVGESADSVAREISLQLTNLDIRTALLEEAGAFINGSLVAPRSPDLASDVGRCLEDPWAQTVVLALPPEEIRTSGLGIDRADLTVFAGFSGIRADVLDLAADASGQVLYMIDENSSLRTSGGEDGFRLFGSNRTVRKTSFDRPEGAVLLHCTGDDVQTYPLTTKGGRAAKAVSPIEAIGAHAVKIVTGLG